MYAHNSIGKVADRGDPSGVGGQDYLYDPLERLSRCGDYTWQASDCDWYCDPHDGCTWRCLSQAKVYSRIQNFTYDSVGNRLDLGAVIATGNRLVKFNGDSLVYDDDGNLIKRIRAGQDIQRLWWNSLGQLIAVWTSGQDSVTFAYDGFWRRVTKRKATQTTWYIYDRFDLLAEVDSATGSRLVEYTFYPGVDKPHSERVGGPTGPTYYYAQDFPGNVIGLINSSNTLVNNYKYEPFGADGEGSTATVANALKFAARQYDSETGLYYVRARYYDPQLGRWASEDPLGLLSDINPYVYVADDPINGTDPSGLGAPAAILVLGGGYALRAALGRVIGGILKALGIGLIIYHVEKTELPHAEPPRPPRIDAPLTPVPWWRRGGRIPPGSAVVVPDATRVVTEGGWSRSYSWGRGLYGDEPGTIVIYVSDDATATVTIEPLEPACGSVQASSPDKCKGDTKN